MEEAEEFGKSTSEKLDYHLFVHVPVFLGSEHQRQ